MKDEVWKDVCFVENGIKYDYVGIYEVSNFGRIRSIGRKGSGCKLENRILKQTKNKQGYFIVTLCKNTKHKNFFVHRLVAHMFIPSSENKPYVDHIIPVLDGGNNNVNNLRWVTTKENCNNKNTKRNNSLSKTGKRNYSAMIKILCVDTNEIFDSITDASNKYNIDGSSISKCCRGLRKTAGGFTWKYYRK